MSFTFIDNFHRPDNSGTMGNAWQTMDPTTFYGILGNSATLEVTGQDLSAVAFQDLGVSDASVELVATNANLLGQFSSNTKLALRCQSKGSYVELTTLTESSPAGQINIFLTLFQFPTFGNEISQYALLNFTPPNIHFTRLGCTMSGSIYTVFLDGVQVWQVDTTKATYRQFGVWGNTYQTNTKHGFTNNGFNAGVSGLTLEWSASTSGILPTIIPSATVTQSGGVFSAAIAWNDPAIYSKAPSSGVVNWSATSGNLSNRTNDFVPVSGHDIILQVPPYQYYYYSGASLDIYTSQQYTQSQVQSFLANEVPPGIFIYSPQYQNARPIGFWGTGGS